MAKQFIKVALCQWSAEHSKQENLRSMTESIQKAMVICPDLDLILFPEYSYYQPKNAQDSVASAEELGGPFIQEMSRQAKRFGVNILPGSFARVDGYKVYNSCPFIDRSGRILATYDKIHLMDRIGARESAICDAGNELCVFDTDFGRVGILLSFDLRFPEQARSLVLKGADLLLCPAAFPSGNDISPRMDHWDLLVRSTALYNLSWVCAVNQFGKTNDEHRLGRSMVVDPWGTPIVFASNREDILFAVLDMEFQRTIRSRVGTLDCRRPDVYDL